MTFEEFNKQVRTILQSIAKYDVLEDIVQPYGSTMIEDKYTQGFTAEDAAAYIALTSQELDEDLALLNMKFLNQKYGIEDGRV